jgi:hypothetical protein
MSAERQVLEIRVIRERCVKPWACFEALRETGDGAELRDPGRLVLRTGYVVHRHSFVVVRGQQSANDHHRAFISSVASWTKNVTASPMMH